MKETGGVHLETLSTSTMHIQEVFFHLCEATLHFSENSMKWTLFVSAVTFSWPIAIVPLDYWAKEVLLWVFLKFGFSGVGYS